MKSNEIMIPGSMCNQSMAVDNIIESLTWGETVPCVSGGNGGSGFEMYKVDSDDLDKVREQLNSYGFNNNPNVAEDFEANGIDFEDYTDCVQFNLPYSGWLQFLLW